MHNPKDDDFNPRKAFEGLSANIEQPHRFAELFCNAALNTKAIDEILKATIRELLTTDKETIETIKKHQREVNEEDWKSIIKRIGWSGWSVILFVSGIAVKTLIDHYIKS